MEYLEAAKIVKQQYPIADFLLVGAMEKMQDSLNDQQLRPYIARGIVSWYGDTKDVRPFLARCSVYVLPSWREGTPRTVLEAMASGRPVITTDVPGCRETVINGRNGFLVTAQNAAALAEKMFGCCSIKAVRKMGRNLKSAQSICSKSEQKDDGKPWPITGYLPLFLCYWIRG